MGILEHSLASSFTNEGTVLDCTDVTMRFGSRLEDVSLATGVLSV